MNQHFGNRGRARGFVLLSLITLGASQASAQYTRDGLDAYQHTYHPDHGYVPAAGAYGLGYGAYGGYGYGGATTAAGSAGQALAGAGQLAQGVGQMNLSNAQAQEAHQQATTQYLQNLQLAQDTALETSAKKAQATQEYDDATKAKIKSQVALYQKTLEQMSAAHRLTAEQMDVGSGNLHWPFCLRGSQYSQLRESIDQLWDARTPEDSGKDSSGYDQIQNACQEMQKIVNAEVRSGLPVNDFVTAKHFISSVEYEAGFKVKPAK